jgi:HSP20 family protein
MHPFPVFTRDLERMFEDFFSVFGPPMRGDGQHGRMQGSPGRMQGSIVLPRMDVSETDSELRITADLPGMQEQDIDITLADDVLTIRGETVKEHEEKKQEFHLMERAHGSFARSLRLPFPVDASQVQASFKDGVLTITIPKPKEVRDKAQRIEVRRDESAGGSQPSGGQQGASADGQHAGQQPGHAEAQQRTNR